MIHLGDEQQKPDTCLSICGFCVLAISALALIAGSVAYIVFGIIYLIQDYDVAHDCSESNLWAYILTALILSWFRCGATNTETGDSGIKIGLCVFICLGLIDGGLAIWGGIELWQNACTDLSESQLWDFGLATFCLQVICAGVCLIIFLPFGVWSMLHAT